MLDILILLKNIQEELKKLIRKLLKNSIMIKLNFRYKIEVKNNICINVFGHENKLVFLIYVSGKKFKDSMDLLLLIEGDKSHYVYISQSKK